MTVYASDPNAPHTRLISEVAKVIVESQRAHPHSAPGHWAGALHEAGLLVDPETFVKGSAETS